MLLREDHDVASLSPAELRRPVGGLMAEVARLAEENAALRDEVARLRLETISGQASRQAST
jgi:uncharacterized small protein (DUF1192 family)